MQYIINAISILCLSTTAHAAWNDIKSKEFSLTPYPIENSNEYAEDIAGLLELQATRTEDDCNLAESQKWPTFQTLFRDSELFNVEDFKQLELLERVVKFASRVADYHKGKFTRPRPYTSHPDLVIPCIHRPTGDRSYPSSHAAMASASACVVATVFPELKDKILSYGAYLSDLRVMVGVHYPSDVAAGKKLGQEICERLLQEADFIDELKPADF